VGSEPAHMQAFDEHFEVVVVGAGHAGCEAAMAAARMGLKTALFTLNVDLIAQMSCNPAIGGIAKGHLVREVDALGGIMGEITDAVGIQFRLLNTSRGPAVWSPRAQCDKQAYRLKMREVLESQANLKIKQAEVADVILGSTQHSAFSAQQKQVLPLRQAQGQDDNVVGSTENRELRTENFIRGVLLRDGRRVSAETVIITTGTFLNGLIHCGEQQYPAGRSGEAAAVLLGERLRSLGCGDAGSRRERLRVLTGGRLTGRALSGSRGIWILRRSVFARGGWRITTRRCRATSRSLPKKRIVSFARTCIVRRCTAVRFSRRDRGIVLRLKTRSSSSRTK